MNDLDILRNGNTTKIFAKIPELKKVESKIKKLQNICVMRYDEENNELYLYNDTGVNEITFKSESLLDFINILQILQEKMKNVYEARENEKSEKRKAERILELREKGKRKGYF